MSCAKRRWGNMTVQEIPRAQMAQEAQPERRDRIRRAEGRCSLRRGGARGAPAPTFRRIFSPICSSTRCPRISPATGPSSSPLSPNRRGRFCSTARRARRRCVSKRPAAAGDGAVLQIVNDDMPFLVDSVTGELDRTRPRNPAAGSSGSRGRARRGGQARRLQRRAQRRGPARKLHAHPRRRRG